MIKWYAASIPNGKCKYNRFTFPFVYGELVGRIVCGSVGFVHCVKFTSQFDQFKWNFITERVFCHQIHNFWMDKYLFFPFNNSVFKLNKLRAFKIGIYHTIKMNSV